MGRGAAEDRLRSPPRDDLCSPCTRLFSAAPSPSCGPPEALVAILLYSLYKDLYCPIPMAKQQQRVFVAFEIEPHLKAGLDALKERDGLPLNFQVSKAIERWLAERGIAAAPAKATKSKRTGKR